VTPPELEPIHRSAVYEQVVERLRDFIDARQLKPGDRLMSERDLAEQLGVSRTSVRQAITALKVLGLVESRHGDGVYLLRPSGAVIPTLASEIVDSEADHPLIWEVREGIEVQAARLAARRRTDKDLRAMRGALRDMASSIAGGGDGIEGDRGFHRAIAQAAHNPFLAQLTDQLAAMIDRTSAASLTTAGRPEISLQAHAAILSAIEDGDEAGASELMRQHIEKSAETVLGAAAAAGR
jgi:GntR family transcriptional regulator, transcriptional repressor for pyruvate dehydrogenase complex